MEKIVMSPGVSGVAMSLPLSKFIRRQMALKAAHTGLVARSEAAGVRHGPTRAGWRMSCVLAATTLLYALSPGPAAGSALSERVGGANQDTKARTVPAQEPAAPAVSLTQSPLVMRLSKDEFRVAFGIKSVGCAANGCRGAIRYRVNWKAEDGTTRWEIREVDYTVAPNTARTITVDRQYFDTAEGAHTTEVMEVTVARMTVRTGAEGGVLSQKGSYTPGADVARTLVSQRSSTAAPSNSK